MDGFEAGFLMMEIIFFTDKLFEIYLFQISIIYMHNHGKIFFFFSYFIYSTLQEMCCGFLLSWELWYRKSVLPGTGAGCAELKID